jgi:hypothetical protein
MTHSGDARFLASVAAVKPVVLGGETAQDWPVVIQTTASGNRIVSAVVAIDVTRPDGESMTMRDGFDNLAVKRGKFGKTWGPQTVRLDDGATVDVSGSIVGKFNRDRSRVSGTWTYRGVVMDAAGTVVETDDSGTVAWSARQ